MQASKKIKNKNKLKIKKNINIRARLELNFLRYNQSWLLENINARQREVPNFNILVLGVKGAGKSSFINLLDNTQKSDSDPKWKYKCPTASGSAETVAKWLTRVDLFPHVRIFDFFGFDFKNVFYNKLASENN